MGKLLSIYRMHLHSAATLPNDTCARLPQTEHAPRPLAWKNSESGTLFSFFTEWLTSSMLQDPGEVYLRGAPTFKIGL